MTFKLTDFGFRWGQIEVTRMSSVARHNGVYRCVQVKTDHSAVDIYVSPTGRSIRIFKNGKEIREAK